MERKCRGKRADRSIGGANIGHQFFVGRGVRSSDQIDLDRTGVRDAIRDRGVLNDFLVDLGRGVASSIGRCAINARKCLDRVVSN